MSTGSLWLIWICCFSGLYKSSICKRPPKIVGGKKVSIKELPFMASLMLKEINWHLCGGAIISKNYIITGAHCLETCSKAKGCIALKKEEVFIRVGSTKWKQGGKKYDIQKIFSHRKYNNKTMINDIALMKIKGEFKFTDKIQVIPIALKSKVPGEGAKVNLVGWGRTAFASKNSSVALKKTEHRIFSHKECKLHYIGRITLKNICTRCKNENCGGCLGDSGGPVVYKGKLIGIMSFMKTGDCMSKISPQVHTKVISYLKWIEKHLKV